jgi:hypothetical protein
LSKARVLESIVGGESVVIHEYILGTHFLTSRIESKSFHGGASSSLIFMTFRCKSRQTIADVFTASHSVSGPPK